MAGLTSWVPTVDDVGAWLRARTKDRFGNELGTFTDDTRPTHDQVEILIISAQSDVADQIGYEVSTEFTARARSVAALGAALSVELSYYPEQVGLGRSPYDRLKTLYDDRLTRLSAAMAESGQEDSSNAVSPRFSPGHGLHVYTNAFANPFYPGEKQIGWDDRW